ncbi:MAG: hypothetical protein ABIU76_14725, partial [Gemmatimonadaceae bacterium]
RRSAIAVSVAVAACAVVGLLALGDARHAREGVRVPRAVVTGPAAAAIGDSGIFSLPSAPAGVRPIIARADAESAAVAFAYGWEAPSRWVMPEKTNLPHVRPAHVEIRPTERRHICDRSYYVRPVVALPDTLVVQSVTSSVISIWGPAWVVPVCDDAGTARATVLITDAPMALQVVLGHQPGSVPELVFPPGTFPHIGMVNPGQYGDHDRGVTLSPERAVTVATTQLAASGARVVEVPEAFAIVLSTPGPSPGTTQASPQGRGCPRWRLVLDREVTLRGLMSGQLVHTRTVYVSRDKGGCGGAVALEVPRAEQPTTLPFSYGVQSSASDSTVRTRDGRSAAAPMVEFRWTALRVTAPIWYEGARLERSRP